MTALRIVPREVDTPHEGNQTQTHAINCGPSPAMTDPLGPARGITVGVLLGSTFWAVAFAVATSVPTGLLATGAAAIAATAVAFTLAYHVARRPRRYTRHLPHQVSPSATEVAPAR